MKRKEKKTTTINNHRFSTFQPPYLQASTLILLSSASASLVGALLIHRLLRRHRRLNLPKTLLLLSNPQFSVSVSAQSNKHKALCQVCTVPISPRQELLRLTSEPLLMSTGTSSDNPLSRISLSSYFCFI